MSNVTLIGLGAMGSALAKALVNGGHATTVWNRTQSGIDGAVSIGATGAADIIEAINASEVLLVCLSNYTATRSILDTDEARCHLAGKTLVQMGTGTPSEARENESWMKDLGGDYLDVTIQPYPEGIGAPESRFFISGSESAFKLSQPYLELFGGDLRYLGENVGAANTLDLSELIYSIGQHIAFAHAARICEAEGVRLDQFATLFKEGEPARDLADMVHSDNYEVGAILPGASVNTWEGCIKLIQDHARLGKLNSEIPDFYSDLFNRAIDSGYGEEDVASIVKVLRENAKAV
jgi:3-hydroxyisobutyrate dehydrogenase-like beta-hydroxyacid dehydrogenase